MKNFINAHRNHLNTNALILVMLLMSIITTGQTPGLYPKTFENMLDIKSPAYINDSVETIQIVTKGDRYALVPVTVEDGKPLIYSYKAGTYMGKDQQLLVDKGDFPELAKTGLHSEERLDNIKAITGIPVRVINCTGRPEAYSGSGFMAEDEDIISVLKSDNRTVRRLGLTHPQLAKPLFHVWNLILAEYESGNWARFYDNIKHIYYNDNILNFQASGSKGWQISIFMDEVNGRHNIHIDRELTKSEEDYLNEKYSYLSPEKMKELKIKLSTLNFSEMLPYYIMRYGFYEGHTDYRTDPVSIAFIFGLQSIRQIDENLGGQLYNTVFNHFISK